MTDNLLCFIRDKCLRFLFFLTFSSVTGFFNMFLNLTLTATNLPFLSVGSIKASFITSTIPTISLPMFE